LGFDNATYYSIDRQHPHLGGVPGMSSILRADSALTSFREIRESYQKRDIYHRRRDVSHPSQ